MLRPTFFVLGLLASALGSCGRAVDVPGADYTFALNRPAAGHVSTVLRLSQVGPGVLELRGALCDALLHVSALRMADEAGRVLPFERRTENLPSGRFTTYCVDLGQRVESLVVEYDIEPSVYQPPTGESEFRQCGTVTTAGCALSLLNIALVPSCPLSEVTLEAHLPEDWREVVSLPGRLALTSPAAWWDAALVAGHYRAVDQPNAGGTRVSLHASTPDEVAHALGAVLGELQRQFGAPRAPLQLVLAPFLEGREPVELPGWVQATVVDVRQVDAGSLARLLRCLVPAWFGRRPAEIEDDHSPEGWFVLGLCEYLALELPGRLGLVRSQLARIERQWIVAAGPARFDPESAAPTHGETRRQGAAALIHHLFHTWPSVDSLEDALRKYSGRGYPGFSRKDPAALFDAYLSSVVRNSSRSLFFDDDWSFELAATPKNAEVTSVARVLDLAFTSETEGYLESCGCKQAKAGGVAQRARALADLRNSRPELLLFDLGNFSPVEGGRPRLEPLVEEELHVYVEALSRMSYDGVCIGPDELYCGSPWLRSTARNKVPLLATGLRLGAGDVHPGSAVLDRAGLSVGFVATSNLARVGTTREAHETNLAGAVIPDSMEPLLEEIRRLRPKVDVLVVGGRMQPSSLRALCAPGIGVDLVLLGGLSEHERPGDVAAGFLGDTAVVLDRMGFYGFNTVKLALDREHRPVAVAGDIQLLDQRDPADPRVQSLIDDFNASLVDRPDLVAGMKPLFSWDVWQRDDYVGAESCAACHRNEYDQWRQTPHAKAMDSLIEVHRDRQPKCVQCHVLGFEARTGYRIGRPDPGLVGIQCETCHGAGGEHARAPLEGRMRRAPTQRVCEECHDDEHSDRFEGRFPQAWSSVAHGPRSEARHDLMAGIAGQK